MRVDDLDVDVLILDAIVLLMLLSVSPRRCEWRTLEGRLRGCRQESVDGDDEELEGVQSILMEYPHTSRLQTNTHTQLYQVSTVYTLPSPQ